MELNHETGNVMEQLMEERIVVQMIARFGIAVPRYLVQLLVVGARGVTGLSAPPRVRRRAKKEISLQIT
ncbi:hypothetical protein DPMN_179248 [Dreissena polymorpha]|uniref:Uncharacterized protein n=1 Tax=Dreissena polymorpha TaxID=45954 RepID=A0A9D4IKL4_DREPO|nr:hypothetical protein DPMN_179248 [Dreissena polymorpha]